MIILMYNHLDVYSCEYRYSFPRWVTLLKKREQKKLLGVNEEMHLKIFLSIIYFAFVIVNLG